MGMGGKPILSQHLVTGTGIVFSRMGNVGQHGEESTEMVDKIIELLSSDEAFYLFVIFCLLNIFFQIIRAMI